jgi:uncharacterized CHY-type Zn-finger protein
VTDDDTAPPERVEDGDSDASTQSDGSGERDASTRNGATSDDSKTLGSRLVGEHRVHGIGVDADTRCGHYDTDRDVVAIRFACCGEFYPCHACHEACTDHDPDQWARERFAAPAVLCGACTTTLSVAAYLDCEDACPTCGHEFNPGCAAHADRYFEV